MKYIETTKAAGPWHPEKLWQKICRKILITILPRANPNFDDKYRDVRVWWLEIDDKDSKPNREIGFGSDGKPIVIGPYGNNYGFWTDSDESVDVAWGSPVEAERFNQAWDRFEKEWGKKKQPR
jgi:hypothetical protein